MGERTYYYYMAELQYFGHSFFKLKDGSETILIDPVFNTTKTVATKQQKIPVKKEDLKNISMILITNELDEHCDKAAIESIAKRENALVLAHDYILQDLELSRNQKISVSPNSELFLKGFKIKTAIAHNPKSFCPTGYIIEKGGKSLYHAGTTRLIDSFSGIKADTVILPVSPHTMDVVDVVRAAKIMKPKTLIPMQHDIFEIQKQDVKDLDKRIKESVLNTKTVLLTPGRKIRL
jgi:L-ascorbate metabolism protein UlaG (beta-lactamase superfamily)